MRFDTAGHIAQIGDKAEFDAFGTKREANRIRCVVRDGEWHYFNVANLEAMSGLERFDTLGFDAFAVAVLVLASPRAMCGLRHVNRDREFLGKHVKATDVVGMLVCDQNAVEGVRVKSGLRQSPAYLAARES